MKKDAEQEPFTPDAALDVLRFVLAILESDSPLLAKARVYLRALIGRGIGVARAASAAGDELQEALKPFADAGEALDKPHGIYFTKAEHERAIIYGISADDLRAAAAALHSIPCADEPDIFAEALASQLDAIRRAAFDECIAIVPQIERRIMLAQPGEKLKDIIEAELIAARDATDEPRKTRSDKGKAPPSCRRTPGRCR